MRRIRYTAGNQAPTCGRDGRPHERRHAALGDVQRGGSSDPDGDALTYAWDLDGDGAYDDSSSVSPTFTYTSARHLQVGLRVTDSHGA